MLSLQDGTNDIPLVVAVDDSDGEHDRHHVTRLLQRQEISDELLHPPPGDSR